MRRASAIAGLLGTLALSCIGTAQAIPLLADANCDGIGSAADFVAASIVAQDTFALHDCRGADPFCDGQLTPQTQELLLNDVFHRLELPWTPTPTKTPTTTRTPSLTRTATATRTPSQTGTITLTASLTPTPSASPTNTSPPTPTRTATPSVTPTSTFTPSATRTPTGIAQQFAGTWSVHWGHGIESVCFLAGIAQPCPLCVPDTTYKVTAVNSQLDVINQVTGETLGRGLPIVFNGNEGTVVTRLTRTFGDPCFGVLPQQVFDYALTFDINGIGTALVNWSYGANTNCAVCEPHDTGAMQRIGP
ncbi:MAG: hypothetical protein HYR72_25440 [Deltaproteobacteria bacterium]|nr:hypothetical protein [Deltaproteobacteria bacterium]MBI3388444.1 hypothetical protein [Deltaproteobacteria bacterium]